MRNRNHIFEPVDHILNRILYYKRCTLKITKKKALCCPSDKLCADTAWKKTIIILIRRVQKTNVESLDTDMDGDAFSTTGRGDQVSGFHPC